MTRAATKFWDMGTTISHSLGSTNPERDGRTMAVMLDGLLLDRLTHPPQDQEVVVAALRWLLSGAPPDGAAGDQPGPRNT